MEMTRMAMFTIPQSGNVVRVSTNGGTSTPIHAAPVIPAVQGTTRGEHVQRRPTSRRLVNLG
jgi:hypothetical protein